MKILYYNHSFRSEIGGGTHAREVFQSLENLPGIKVVPFPSPTIGEVSRNSEPKMSKLSWFPEAVERWLRFWVKPLRGEMGRLGKQLTQTCDVIFFRPNALLRLVPAIKRRFPSIHLCVEINALIHSECLRGVRPRWFWSRMEAMLINRADSVMVVSDYLKKQLVRLGVCEAKILVNPNGVNPKQFGEGARAKRDDSRKELNLPADAFVLGYVGGMEPFRRLPLMVSQVLELMQNDDRIFFVMAGDGVDRAEVDRLLTGAPAELRGRIRFDGAVPYENVPALMSSFDCALFPYSNPYGSPQKLFEYMAMGIPVIGPDVPVVREGFEDQKHLLLADQSGGNFLMLLKRIIEDPKFAGSIARRGQELSLSSFSWHHNATRLIEFLKQRTEIQGLNR